MSATAGRNGEIKLKLPTTDLGNPSGATAVVLGQLRSWSFDDTVETLDTTVMNGAASGFVFKNTMPSFKSWTITVDFIYDPADAAQGTATLKAGNDTEISLYPESDSESASYIGTGLITSLSRSASFDGLIECSLTIEGKSAIAITL